jgi:cysteine desulfurase family protein
MHTYSQQDLIYFDNSATSWPKPPGVAEAMVHFLTGIGASPGRSGHQLAIESSRIVYDTREKISALFNAPDPLHVVFTKNITEAINLVLYGLLKPGDHVITSSMEHNSVMRPLRALEEVGVEITVVQCTPDGMLNPHSIEKAIRANTRLVIINHSSNVIGTILPIRKIGEITQKYDVLFLVDTAQSAGRVVIDMAKDHIDLLAFTGHKSLLGPMGTGGLVLGDRVDSTRIAPLIRGGTGSRSEKERQPEFLPDAFEGGTQNAVGIAGLGAGIDWILEKGVGAIREYEIQLTQQLIDELKMIPGVTVYSPSDARMNTGTVSFNISGLAPSEVGLSLDEDFDVLSRVGLHCAPAAHKTIGTYPSGTIRFGLGIFNTSQEVEDAIQAVAKIAKVAR